MRQTILTAGFTMAFAAGASAHAFLKSAQPAVGSAVPGSPTQVIITFTEAIEPHFSTIGVLDKAGTTVDDAQLVSTGPTTLAVGLKPLLPGTYKVVWHATAVDTHKTDGSFTFTVTQ